MNKIESRIALLRTRTPILAGLLLSLHDKPDVSQLDDWVYCCSGSYATLGALLSEMHPAYDGLTIDLRFFDKPDGHNAFEEFVIAVFDSIARYLNAFDGHVYDMDKITAEFMVSHYAEPPTDDTGGGRY